MQTTGEGKAPESSGSEIVSGAEAKGQVRSIDLAMVAKASLRASERPFGASSSGEQIFGRRAIVLTRRRLKSGGGERWSGTLEAFRCRSDTEHAGGLVNRAVNPGWPRRWRNRSLR